MTDLISTIMDLGGGGATMAAVMKMWAQSKRESASFSQQKQEFGSGKIAGTRAFFKSAIEETAEFAFVAITIVCVIVLLAPIIMPVIADVTVHYYYPKDYRFLFFDWDALKEIKAGSGKNHIMILPIHISLCANYIGFFLTGRAMRVK